MNMNNQQTKRLCHNIQSAMMHLAINFDADGNSMAESDAYKCLEDAMREFTIPPVSPTIVCLCGSTRFWREFQRASLRETMDGKIVLSIGAASGTDDEHFGNLPREEYDQVKAMLDDLHKRKIDLADEVLILNVGGYIGDSTRSELEYAQRLGVPVRFLEIPVNPPQAKCPDCGRVKAVTAEDCANGYCPKWYAIRDADAERDCQRHRPMNRPPNPPTCQHGKVVAYGCKECGAGRPVS